MQQVQNPDGSISQVPYVIQNGQLVPENKANISAGIPIPRTIAGIRWYFILIAIVVVVVYFFMRKK